MECFAPIYIKNPRYIPPSQQKASKGVWSDKKGNIVIGGLKPFDENYAYVKVPCGRCEACLKRRVTEWTNRLLIEQTYSKSAFFVTLDYADEYLTLVDGVPVLNKSDFQTFFRNFRRLFPKPEDKGDKVITYYCCGEYGSKFGRPHFHFILFCRKDYYTFDEISRKVFATWHKGHYQIGTVTGASCRYVAKYSLKRPDQPNGTENFPPFALISKGISLGYVSDYRPYHNADNMYVIVQGEKTLMPRYLRERLYSEDDRAAEAMKIAKRFDKDPTLERMRIEAVLYNKKMIQKRKAERDKL